MVTIREISEFPFSEETERDRIERLFKEMPEYRKILNEILDEFLKMNMDKVVELFNNLPYSDDDGCPGQEYVCSVITECIMNYGAFGKTYEIIPNKS